MGLVQLTVNAPYEAAPWEGLWRHMQVSKVPCAANVECISHDGRWGHHATELCSIWGTRTIPTENAGSEGVETVDGGGAHPASIVIEDINLWATTNNVVKLVIAPSIKCDFL